MRWITVSFRPILVVFLCSEAFDVAIIFFPPLTSLYSNLRRELTVPYFVAYLCWIFFLHPQKKGQQHTALSRTFWNSLCAKRERERERKKIHFFVQKVLTNFFLKSPFLLPTPSTSLMASLVGRVPIRPWKEVLKLLLPLPRSLRFTVAAVVVVANNNKKCVTNIEKFARSECRNVVPERGRL